jgi:hypothetical protein
MKLLAYLALIGQRGASLNGIIDCVAATRQNFSSSKSMTHMGLLTGPMQAAHFLPGEIRIGGRAIWEFATSPRTRANIEFLFTEVEHLPVAFNQADTAAEDRGQTGGLCSALVVACAALLRCAVSSRPRVRRMASRRTGESQLRNFSKAFLPCRFPRSSA